MGLLFMVYCLTTCWYFHIHYIYRNGVSPPWGLKTITTEHYNPISVKIQSEYIYIYIYIPFRIPYAPMCTGAH